MQDMQSFPYEGLYYCKSSQNIDEVSKILL